MTAISESDAMALQVTDVTKHYDSGFTLDDVTFDLPKGYIMGLIGPNGAGKSTLIKLILNMIHRDAGSIHVLGLDNIANEEPVKEQLGVVFDFSYMHEQWQVKNIERIVAPLYPSWDGGCYHKYLDTFGLGDAQNGKKHIKDLSRGMQMKLMLAIALSHDAKLLILDEPANFVDNKFEKELYHMLHELNSRMAIVMVSHDIGTITSVVKEIVCVNRQVHRHHSNRITEEQLRNYDCPIQLLTHGHVPHTVLEHHPGDGCPDHE